jgi:hypothetical protein
MVVNGMSNDDLDIARQIARGVRDGRIDIVSGCREILSYRRVIRGVSNETWDVITAIESETDDVPIGDEREKWNADALAKKSAEAAAYVERVRAAAREAFAEIAKALGA